MKERYIYQVIRRLPKEQREEIKMELEELIDDMCENDTIEHVLEKLGDPEEFAKKYRNENSYVIGPKYYDTYLWVLKIALICTALSAVCSSVLNGIITRNWKAEGISEVVNVITEIIADTIGNGIVSLCTAFGIVTLIFALMERQNVKMKEKQPGVWKPEQLTPIPDKKSVISRSDCVIGMVFILLFGGILLFAPELIGAYVFENKEYVRSIPIFNLEKWSLILPFLIAVFLLAFMDEMVQLVTGYYCKAVMVSNIVTGVLQIILAIIILKVFPFWNPDFARECSESFGKKFTSKGDLMHYWGTDVISNVVLAGIIIITLCEMGVIIYRTLKFGIEKAE